METLFELGVKEGKRVGRLEVKLMLSNVVQILMDSGMDFSAAHNVYLALRSKVEDGINELESSSPTRSPENPVPIASPQN